MRLWIEPIGRRSRFWNQSHAVHAYVQCWCDYYGCANGLFLTSLLPPSLFEYAQRSNASSYGANSLEACTPEAGSSLQDCNSAAAAAATATATTAAAAPSLKFFPAYLEGLRASCLACLAYLGRRRQDGLHEETNQNESMSQLILSLSPIANQLSDLRGGRTVVASLLRRYDLTYEMFGLGGLSAPCGETTHDGNNTSVLNPPWPYVSIGDSGRSMKVSDGAARTLTLSSKGGR
ncbi:hypothetical protein G7Y89_g439 [Cudoniella acicularis]|uniref:Uncharacterized protein n=1 Tax=Cudoniella acicularis TaxID=354080 RepID=A0A8H4W7Y1_9HELO|nr:hypothetical protein G7Y89_g439 [Cudoniella acicularis]